MNPMNPEDFMSIERRELLSKIGEARQLLKTGSEALDLFHREHDLSCRVRHGWSKFAADTLTARASSYRATVQQIDDVADVLADADVADDQAVTDAKLAARALAENAPDFVRTAELHLIMGRWFEMMDWLGKFWSLMETFENGLRAACEMRSTMPEAETFSKIFCECLDRLEAAHATAVDLRCGLEDAFEDEPGVDLLELSTRLLTCLRALEAFQPRLQAARDSWDSANLIRQKQRRRADRDEIRRWHGGH